MAGDWHPLAEQLGSTDGLLTLASASSVLRIEPVRDLCSLRRFLQAYHARILLAFELPAIHSAHTHATYNGVQELVARTANWPASLCSNTSARPAAASARAS